MVIHSFSLMVYYVRAWTCVSCIVIRHNDRWFVGLADTKWPLKWPSLCTCQNNVLTHVFRLNPTKTKSFDSKDIFAIHKLLHVYRTVNGINMDLWWTIMVVYLYKIGCTCFQEGSTSLNGFQDVFKILPVIKMTVMWLIEVAADGIRWLLHDRLQLVNWIS